MSSNVRLVSLALVLCFLVTAVRPVRAGGDPGDEACAAVPPNIQVHEFLQQAVQILACRSETFRRQCRRIAGAPHARIAIVPLAGRRSWSGPRASTMIGRYAYGSLRAIVEIPLPSEHHELIPHELEHVIEQIEGLDLPTLARSGDPRVIVVGKGLFETGRAQAAGRAAAREVR